MNRVDVIQPYAFVDGSFNLKTRTYGYGGFLVYNDEYYKLQGSGNDPEIAAMRNIGGELLGCMAAVQKAIELKIGEINIYYDYLGIERWAMGKWMRKNKYTKEYYSWFQGVKNKVKINFIKVKSHSGIDGNEIADKLAKQAVGII